MTGHRAEGSRFHIASAPCSWGIEDPANPHNPPWKTVLNEAQSAGYKGLELGPYGYLPTDPSQLRDELGKRDLSICAGTIFEPLWDKSHREKTLEKTRGICQLLSVLGTKHLVVIDSVNSVRCFYAGIKEHAPRLGETQWNVMMNTINDIADIATQEFGITPVLHPHVGGYIEFEDEITRALNDLSPERIDLCLDTGHCTFSGMDPSQWLKNCSERLRYVHFKDINKERLDHAIYTEMGFWEACKYGVMCSIGEGFIDYSEIRKTLIDIDYKGWVVIEQERDPRAADTSLLDVTASLEYLKKTGY